MTPKDPRILATYRLNGRSSHLHDSRENILLPKMPIGDFLITYHIDENAIQKAERCARSSGIMNIAPALIY
jgi:hypothetical protein